MPAEFDNAIQTLCELSESSDELFRIPENGPDRGAELRFMMGLGAIEFGARPETVVCGACDADHPAAIEYDSERRCYVHFCPEAGFVTVNDAVLTTYRYRPEWLVDCLVKALHVISPVRPRAIVPACAWHLGDTKCGNTLVTIVFARRIAGQLALGQLASALRAVHPADKGVVITTSLNALRTVPLPSGYEFFHLPDLVMHRPNGIAVDESRFGSWIRQMPSRTGKGAPSRSGRPSQGETIAEIFRLRRASGLPIDNFSAEARSISAVWAEHKPDQQAPAPGTVRAHVARLAKDHQHHPLETAQK